MIKLLIALTWIVLSGCLEQRPDTYSGVSGDVACSWDIIHQDRGQCVSEGRRYRCIRQPQRDATGFWNHISCTPFRLWK